MNSMNSPRQLYKFLSQRKGNIADLITQAKINQKLSKSLNNLLDPVLVDHVSLANISDQSLILITDSAAWASRARYFSPLLLQKLNNNSHLFGDIKKIEIQVQAATFNHPAPQPLPRHISESAAKCIRATADIIEEGELKAALQRLAKRDKKK
ncbi:hypothetical protein MNBD_GAMMA25-1570 [hydrothermal vent metagenome]|uniref:Zn-ribbon-containing, possibly RNA-binding protein and truncated derivatives n=1 Tax=hydrothermal vent metagenome TaxID=652676 RepID=A0A3B1BHM5_9ZZZZ